MAGQHVAEDVIRDLDPAPARMTAQRPRPALVVERAQPVQRRRAQPRPQIREREPRVRRHGGGTEQQRACRAADSSKSTNSASSHARSPATASTSSMHTSPARPSPRTAPTRCERQSRIGANATSSPPALAAAQAASSRWVFPAPASPTTRTCAGDFPVATRRTASTSSAFPGGVSKFSKRRPAEGTRRNGSWTAVSAGEGAGGGGVHGRRTGSGGVHRPETGDGGIRRQRIGGSGVRRPETGDGGIRGHGSETVASTDRKPGTAVSAGNGSETVASADRKPGRRCPQATDRGQWRPRAMGRIRRRP